MVTSLWTAELEVARQREVVADGMQVVRLMAASLSHAAHRTRLLAQTSYTRVAKVCRRATALRARQIEERTV